MMAEQAKFWDRMANRYSKQPVSDEAAYRQKLEITQRYFKPMDSVFEFGCGTGGTSIAHAPYVGSILATDVSSKMLEIAEHRREKAGVTNVSFQQFDIEKTTIDREAHDVILGMSILHLIGNKADVIKSVWNGLKPGGYFISSTVCIGTSLGILRFILPIAKPFGLLPNVQFFKEDDLVADLEGSGFVIEHRFRPKPDAAVFLVAQKPR